MESKFKEGDVVLYQNGDRFELGVIKRAVGNKYFVYYNTGDTAAWTCEANLHAIENAYAFDIIRKKCE